MLASQVRNSIALGLFRPQAAHGSSHVWQRNLIALAGSQRHELAVEAAVQIDQGITHVERDGTVMSF